MEKEILKNFFFMGEAERELIKSWLSGLLFKQNAQKDFIQIVKQALQIIDYGYWISAIEPSCDRKGKLFFEEDRKVSRAFSFSKWKAKGKEFWPEMNSELANLYELFLWYAYRCAMGFWTIEYVCENSSSAGNYWNSPKAFHGFEFSGARKVGGFSDGVGNKYKIVTHNSEFLLCGGWCCDLGNEFPVSKIQHCYYPNDTELNGVGVIVLKPNL